MHIDPHRLDWLAPVLLVCLVGIATHLLTVSIVFDPESPAVKEQLQSMPAEQREQTPRSMQ